MEIGTSTAGGDDEGLQLLPTDNSDQVMVTMDQAENSQLLTGGNLLPQTWKDVKIDGGKFHDADIGPTSISATKNVGIERADFRAAHFRSKIKVQKGITSAQQQPVKITTEDQGFYQLSTSVRIFPSKLLAQSPTSKIYEGEIVSALCSRLVAVKLMDYSEENCREAKILLKLQPHTNVVAISLADVYDNGLVKHMYIVMDRCSTLNMEKYIENRIREGVPFNFKPFLDYSRQVIDAIEHIHKNGVIHRDLKPSSLLFSLCGKYLKIVDFGLSKELKSGRSIMSVSRLKIGTDGYRAPETYNKNELSKRADIFSLGLVLHYLWGYGSHPFGDDPEIWNYNIENECKDLDLSGLLIPNPQHAQTLLKAMLKFDPAQRPFIDEVKYHAAFYPEIEETVIDSMNLTWEGCIKGPEDFSCRLLQMPSSPDTGLCQNGWNFRLKNVPRIDLVLLKTIVKGAPTGYLATLSRKQIDRLTETFIDKKQMGWISIISSEGEKEKVLILTCSPDYKELFGIFVQDPTDFISWIQGLVDGQQQGGVSKTLIQEEAGSCKAQAREIPLEKATESTKEQEMSHNRKTSQTADHLSTTHEISNETDEMFYVEQKKQGAKLKRDRRYGAPELIPWWFFQYDRMK